MEHRDLQGVLIEVGDKVVHYTGYSGRADISIGYITRLTEKRVSVSRLRYAEYSSSHKPKQVCIIEKGKA